jgi:hypothetical protein
MLTVKQILDVLAPEFKNYPEPDKDSVITIATLRLSASHFGEVFNQAVALLTAHLLTIAQRNGNAGPQTSVREGDLAIGYGSSGMSRLDVTSYGTELMRLIRERTLGAGTAV